MCSMAPPLPVAVLPDKVQASSDSVPSFEMPPARNEEWLFATVHRVRVSMPLLSAWIAPPPVGPCASFPDTVQSVSVTFAPSPKMAPPVSPPSFSVSTASVIDTLPVAPSAPPLPLQSFCENEVASTESTPELNTPPPSSPA